MGVAKLVNIQALRGVAALLVLFGHLNQIEDRYVGAPVLPGGLSLGFSGVDLFFLISGFVMVHVTLGGGAGRRAAGAFLYSRAARIYPLYWLVSLAVLAVYLARPELVNASQGGEVNVLASFLLVPQERLPLLMVGWTLIHEMYFYAVFALLVWAPSSRRMTYLCLWAVIVAAGAIAGWRDYSAWTDILFHPLTFEFLTGCALAYLIHRGVESYGAVALACGVTWLVALWVWRGLSGEIAFPEGWDRVASFTPGYAAILYGVVALERRGGWRSPGWLQYLGDASYALYLTHILTLSALGRLWTATGFEAAWATPIFIIFAASGSIIVAAFTHNLVERRLLALGQTGKTRLFPKA